MSLKVESGTRERPLPTTRKARETRASILTAAARLFAEKGFADCTLREIATVANMKAGSVYYHFDSKDEILDEVINTGIERLFENVTKALDLLAADAPVERRLREAVRAHILSFLDVRGDANTFLRIYEHLPPIMKRRSRAARQRYATLWFELIDAGVRSGEVDPALNLGIFVPYLIQGLNRIPEWFSPSRMTIDGVCAVIFSTTLKGIFIKADDDAALAAKSARSRNPAAN